MKLSLTFLALALAVATVQAGLAEKWYIREPRVTQDVSKYTFVYSGIDKDMELSNMRSSVTAGDCGGDLLASNNGGAAVGVDEFIEAMTMTYYDSYVDVSGATPITRPYNYGTATVMVDMDMKIVKGGSMPLWNGGNYGGTLEFCVRYGLFTAAGNEVNFLETVVTVTITMDGDFAVSSMSVAEKAKIESTLAQEYTVRAALCGGQDGIVQGSILCVVVLPSSDDVEVTSIDAFTWTNKIPQIPAFLTPTPAPTTSLSPTTQVPTTTQHPTIFPASEAPTMLVTEQVALPNEDGLTSYDAGTDTFSTILYAQFYVTGAQVQGTGTATLGYKFRRLGASGSEMNGRVLQDIDAEQEFDIVVDIAKSDDSPTALQTAGGATASFVVTIVGLVVGAVLLA